MEGALRSNLKMLEGLKAELERILPMLDESDDLWQLVKTEVSRLTESKQKGKAEALSLAAESLKLAEETGGNEALQKIARRSKKIIERYDQPRVAKEPPEPSRRSLVESVLEHINFKMAKAKLRLGKMKRLVKQLEVAMGQAEAEARALNGNRRAVETSLAKMNSCLTALKNLSPPDTDGADEIRATLDDCRYSDAERLLAAMNDGAEKHKLSRRLTDGRALLKLLKGMVSRASVQYRNCRFDDALQTLGQAENKAACTRHKKKLAGHLAKVRAGKAMQAEIRADLDEAEGFYENCRPEDALPILRAALEKTECQGSISEINKEIARNQKLKENVATIKKLYTEANRLYKQGSYPDAKTLLLEAKRRAMCGKHRDSLAGKIEKVQARMDSAGTGTGRISPPDPDPVEDDDCRALMARMNKQVSEIRRLHKEYSALKRSLIGRMSLEALGPSACLVKDAEDALDNLKNKAEAINCAEGRRIGRPYASAAHRVECNNYRQTQGGGNCKNLLVQLHKQSDEIKRLFNIYAALRESSPLPDRSVLGPAACRVVDAQKAFLNIWMKAKNAECLEATKIEDPLGIGATHRLECHRYREGGG